MIKHSFSVSLGSILTTVIAATVLTFATAAWADWVDLGGAEVAPNIAEIEIQDDGVHLRLEVFAGDISKFSDLVPIAWQTENGISTAPNRARIQRSSRDGLSIRTAGAGLLSAEVVHVERRIRIDRASPLAGTVDPFSGRLLPSPPEDPSVIFVELFYPFGETRPDALTIAPPLDQTGDVRAQIGMIVFHRSVPVTDFRFLSSPATVELDWDDPWNSRFDNPNLVRHHRSPRMVFLYAEPYEIRQEALVRVRAAADLVGLDVTEKKLQAEKAQSLAEAVVNEIEKRSRMTIEDRVIIPDFDRGAFMRVGMRGLEFLEQGETVDLDAHILGLIWSAPVDGLPEQAQLEWGWFDDTGTEIPAYSIDAAGPFLSPITKEEPILTWTNHFKVDPYPDVVEIGIADRAMLSTEVYVLGGIALFGAGIGAFGLARRKTDGSMSFYAGLTVAVLGIAGVAYASHQNAKRIPTLAQEQLVTLTEGLLNNVYRAFNFRTEDQVYDRLALTLNGNALEQVYLAQREALRIDGAGDAKARVNALNVRETLLNSQEKGMLNIRTDWTVTAQVGHWGHAHTRTNAYLAELEIVPVDGSWKIMDFEVLREDRLQ